VRAVQVTRFGGPEVLRVAEVERKARKGWREGQTYAGGRRWV